MRGIEGKVALVAGAACPPGLGRATALRLAQAGAAVACVERVETATPDGPVGGLPDSACATRGALDAVVEEIRAAGGRAIALQADVSRADQVESAVSATLDEFGRLDLCCSVSGGLGPRLGNGSLMEIDEASFDRCVDLNFKGAWLVARACARPMIQAGRGGSIALLSSWAAVPTYRNTGVFCAAKAGVDRLVHGLAWELGEHGIRVNAVRPLGVDPQASGNPYLQSIVGRNTAGDWAGEKVALRRMQSPTETAAVLTFLLSDEASFVTGEIVDVSGAGLL